MAEKVLSTVRYLAERIIRENSYYFSAEMLDILPKQLLGTILTDSNLYQAMLQVDYIRFAKERLLLWDETGFRPLAPGSLPDQFSNMIIDLAQKKDPQIPDWQKVLVKEIKFLACLGSTVIHQ